MKIKRKLIPLLLVLITVLTPALDVFAGTMSLAERTGYTYVGYSPLVNRVVNHGGIFVMRMDGRVVFCIESGIPVFDGVVYVPEEFVYERRDRLAQIAFHGFTNTAQTHRDYAITQIMIWQELGDIYVSSNIPNFEQRRNEILALVDRHEVRPSWNNNEVTVIAGRSVTLTDTNGVFQDMIFASNNTGTNISRNGNNLTITADANSSSGAITYRKFPENTVGTSVVYRRPNEQSVVEFFLSGGVETQLRVNVVHLGHLQVRKVDEETGQPLANTRLRFEFNGSYQEVVTDARGLATVRDIQEGTEVTVTEVRATHGYVNAGEVIRVTIRPNETIEVTLNNRAQRGIARLTKLGQTPVEVTIRESAFGDVWEFVNDYRPLAGVTFRIEAAEDIITADGTIHARRGETVARRTTNANGQWQSPELHLGRYYAIEESAPYGFVIDDTPIPFHFEYAGQFVELASATLTVTNDFQSLNIEVLKYEEYLVSWENNQPNLNVIPGEGKVFGLFVHDVRIESEIFPQIPEDVLVAYRTVTEGVATFENLMLPEGIYYIQELYAGDYHVLDTTKHFFEFTAENNYASFPILVFQEGVVYGLEALQRIYRPSIVNRLHMNQFTIRKINQEATLNVGKGFEFSYTGVGTDAVFTLEDVDGQIVQRVRIDQDGLGVFENVPVGTFFLREEAPSSDRFLLSDAVIRIESTTDGIRAYDEDDNLLTEQDTENEDNILLEIKNYLVIGGAQLTKRDVATSAPLPNTGIEILDESRNVVVAGRTDANGIFIFEELPAGIYYFREFDPPPGFVLDETPIRFEIREHGVTVKAEMTNQRIEERRSLPQTGDSTTMLLPLLGAALSLTAIGIVYAKRKKSNAEQAESNKD